MNEAHRKAQATGECKSRTETGGGGMNKADELRCAIIDRVSACTSERELDLIFRFVRGVVEFDSPIDTRRRIVAMLGECSPGPFLRLCAKCAPRKKQRRKRN